MCFSNKCGNDDSLSPPCFKFGTQTQQEQVDIFNFVLNFAVVLLVGTEIRTDRNWQDDQKL